MFFFSRFKISGHSMEPVLFEGDSVIVSFIPFFFKSPKIGDIVLFLDNKNNKYLIKRIKEIDKENYFLIGDNIKDSKDSRYFGYISKKNILGKVILKF